MLRIGLLTSGGDCQALNATMRGIVKTLMTNSKEPIEIYGFEDGYQGLIYSRFRVMTPADFSGILTRGGTILGTSRTPFKRLDIPEADGVEKVPAMVHTYHKLQLDCLFMLDPPRPPTACAKKASTLSPCPRPSITTPGAPS